MRKDLIFEVSILLIATALFVLSIFYRKEIESWMTKEILVYGMIIVFIASFLMELLPQYITPHIFLIEAKILNIPITPLLSVLIIACFFGSIAGFEIGSKYGTRVIDKFYGKKDNHIIKRIAKKHGNWIMALAAVSPLPYIPVAFGSAGVKRNAFLIYGVLTRIAGLIVLALFIGLF